MEEEQPEQLSLLSLEMSTEDLLVERVMQRGPLTAGKKEQIYEFAQTHPTGSEFTTFLKKLYGYEGFSGDELIKQIARKTGYPIEKIEQVRKLKIHLVSLDLKIGGEGNNDGESVLGDFVADERTKGQEEIIERMDMREELTHCMDSCLTGREKEVIRMRFGLDDGRPMTLEEIGSVMAVTRERVRQIEGKALHKLRNPKYVKYLKVYLE